MTRPGNHLRAWRKHHGLTMEQLGERAGASKAMIGHFETGVRGLTHEWLLKLATALETTPGALLEREPGAADAEVLAVWVEIPVADRARAIEVLKAFTPST